MPDTSTLEEKLAALDELSAEAELRLTDAELALREVEAARRGHAAKLSHEDARMARTQLEVLAEARSWLLACQPQGIPAVAENPGASGRDGSGRCGFKAPGAERPSTVPRSASAWVEDAEAR